MNEKPLLIFDGVCNLCSHILRVLLKADEQKKRLRFATSQSPIGQKYYKNYGHDPENFDTILLIMPDGKVYTKSDAAIEVAKIFGGSWHLLCLLAVLPKKWRDGMYDFVAQRRYKWFGKTNYCQRIPEKYLERVSK